MPSRAGTHPTRLWGRYENGRRKYVSQKERQKNETGRKKIRRDAQAASPPSPLLKDCLWAFFVGGAICLLGEGLRMLYAALGFTLTDAGTLTSATLIGLSAFTTAMAGTRSWPPRPVPVHWYPSQALPTRSSPPPSNSATRGLSPAWVQKCSSSQGLSSFTACWPALCGA